MKAKILLGGLILLAGLILGATIYSWYAPDPKAVTIIRVVPKPYKAPESPISKGVVREIAPREIAILKPTSKQLEAIEKKLGGSIPAGDLLGVHDIKPLPYGGRVVTTLPPPNTQEGSEGGVSVTVYPNKPPFFEWDFTRTAGLYTGLAWDSKVGGVQNALLLEVTQDLFRTGPAIWGTRAGTLQLPSGSVSYVMVGAKVKF